MSAGRHPQDAGRMAMPALEFTILQEAAEWFALLRSEDAGEADRDRWRAWLEARPANGKAWQQVEQIECQFRLLPGTLAHDALAAPGQRRRKLAKSMAMLCVSMAAGGALLASRQGRSTMASLTAQYRSDFGASRQVTLADGTSVWLNSASAMDVIYDAGRRIILLHSGEILVQSAPDTQRPARPLAVQTRHGRMRALGTRFTVQMTNADTVIAVFEGAVEVSPADSKISRVVSADSGLRFGNDWIGRPAPCDESSAAWSRGLLTPDNMRLDDFLAELGRYRRGYLGCAPDVAGLRLVGVYPLADTDRILNTLAATLPVQVRRILPWWVIVESQK